MIGIVGNLKIIYRFNNQVHTEIINLFESKTFTLSFLPEVTFSIDEISYIEDTVYCVVVYILKPENLNDEILVSGNSAVTFRIDELDLDGTMELSYFD